MNWTTATITPEVFLMGMASMALVLYPVFLSTSWLNRGSLYALLTFITSPVVATVPAIPLPKGNLRVISCLMWHTV